MSNPSPVPRTGEGFLPSGGTSIGCPCPACRQEQMGVFAGLICRLTQQLVEHTSPSRAPKFSAGPDQIVNYRGDGFDPQNAAS